MKSFKEYLKENEEQLTIYRGIRRYHQTKTVGTGQWFSTSKLVALTYSEGEVISKTINVKNPKIIDCEGKSWKNINTDKLAREYKDFDVIIFKNVIDVGPHIDKALCSGIQLNKNEGYEIFLADTVVINNPDLLKQ